MNKIIAVIWIHWIADFVLQSDKMARGKSSSLKWLSIHIAVYTLPLLIFGWKYALFNGAMHWIIDLFSSKATSYLWKKQDVHNFFVVIGLDQALHMTLLVLSLEWF